MIAPELKQRVIDKVVECKHLSVIKANVSLGPIKIKFDLIGRCAAMANTWDKEEKQQGNVIRINEEYLVKNTEEFIKQIIPHEVAHLIANTKWQRRVKHGLAWQSIMIRVFELTPDRCHQFEAATNGRKHRWYTLTCLYCNCLHRFSQRHYNVIVNTGGLHNRTCRQCKKSLKGGRIILDNG